MKTLKESIAEGATSMLEQAALATILWQVSYAFHRGYLPTQSGRQIVVDWASGCKALRLVEQQATRPKLIQRAAELKYQLVVSQQEGNNVA
jgi:hypothetical protein